MTFQKFKSDSYCVGRRHRSATKNIYGDITSKGSKVLIGFRSVCNRKKSMTVVDNTIKAEGFGSSFKNLGRISAKASKKPTTNVLKNPGRALEIGANVATAAAGKNPKNVFATLPEVIKFYHRGRGVYLGKYIKIMLYKGKQKQKDYTQVHH